MKRWKAERTMRAFVFAASVLQSQSDSIMNFAEMMTIRDIFEIKGERESPGNFPVLSVKSDLIN